MTTKINGNQIQLGDDADTSKNFIISVPATPDGTLSISRMSGGAVLEVDASGNISLPSMSGFGAAPIIESGSNANGSYTKFADGTLLCTVSTTTSGSGFTTITLPAAFSDSNYVGSGIANASNSSNSVSAKLFNKTTTTVQVAVATAGNAYSIQSCDFMFIGRWK